MAALSAPAWGSSGSSGGAPPLHPLSSPALPPAPLPHSHSSSPPFAPLAWRDLLRRYLGGDSGSRLRYIESSGDEICLSKEDIGDSQAEWELSLVGYVVGRRPFYGALLAAFQRKWKLKGRVDLLSLDANFFLFKFTCAEDYNLVFEGGPCFLNGRPFLFRKWAWDYRPVKKDFNEIPEKIFHYGSISLITEPCRSAHLKAMEVAKKARVVLSYDPNLRLPLWPSEAEAKKQIMSIWEQADIIKASDVELEFLTGKDSVEDEVALTLWRPSLKLLLVTLGERGCKYYTKDFRGAVQAFTVKQVDTTGVLLLVPCSAK